MLVYDWMWWGHLTIQNLAWRCTEVCGEMCRGMDGGVWRCTEVWTEVHGKVRRGAWGCAEVCAEVHGGGGEKSGFYVN